MTLPRASTRDYVGLMRAKACLVLVTLTLCTATWAVPKPHVITFGKWTPAKWCVGSAGDKVVEIKIRALFVDTRLKEHTTGAPHEVTERRFVVRRVFRINDSLPEFDSYYSSWKLVPGITLPTPASPTTEKMFAVVAQLGRRKPILKKPLGEPDLDEMPDSECPAPAWQRAPTRVTFQTDDEQKLTCSVRGHAVDIVTNDDEAEAGD